MGYIHKFDIYGTTGRKPLPESPKITGWVQVPEVKALDAGGETTKKCCWMIAMNYKYCYCYYFYITVTIIVAIAITNVYIYMNIKRY